MPGSGSSNNNGRSLEYLIAESLSRLTGAKLSSRALADQLRDSTTVRRIDSRLRTSFTKAAEIVTSWIVTEPGIGSGPGLLVDRHSDFDPGVADITVSRGVRSLGVSVKHNYDALSHPRPYSLVDAMGLDGSAFETDHRARMEVVTERFRTAARGASTFPSLPAGVKLKLYQEACAECAKSVNRIAGNGTAVSTLFSFLVGSNFKKVIIATDKSSRALESVIVADYTKIKHPTSVAASVDNRARASSLLLTFNNGWKIDMRIKNAKTDISRSGQVSLKFDAQMEEEEMEDALLPPIVTLF